MKTHSIDYSDRALVVGFPGGSLESSGHLSGVLNAAHGVAMSLGHLFASHRETDGSEHEVANAIAGVQMLIGLAVAIAADLVADEVTP